MPAQIKAPLAERARGRWASILPMVGIGPQFLTGKHGPCPMCGGKDRWRYIDREGSGDWYCTQCGHGSGTDLVMQYLKVEFKEAAHRIEAVIGAAVVAFRPAKKSPAELIAAMKRVWAQGVSITEGSAPDRFLRKRGIELDHYPACLRHGPGPMMLAKVVSPDGKAVNVHRTRLTPHGDKAEGNVRLLMEGEFPGGSAVRLAPPTDTLGIAEGIETALAASILFGVPVWALLVAQNLAKFREPEGVTRVIVFGDHDDNYTGQAAAYACANRLAIAKVEVDVRLPDGKGADWNDVLMARRTQERSAAA